MSWNFAPARIGDEDVFGACRPPADAFDAWADFMKAAGIQRVVCLDKGAASAFAYDYRRTFGADNVLFELIPDGTLPSPEALRRILEFIAASRDARLPVVVHCAAGIGRTGVVLAAWLVRSGYSLEQAVERVRASGATRDPYEAVAWGTVPRAQVDALISSVATQLTDRPTD